MTVLRLFGQYDGWADLPTVEKPTALALNTINDGIHMFNYFTAGMNDPDVLSFTEGNVTYMMKPTPIAREWQRAEIEACFERPNYRAGACVPS